MLTDKRVSLLQKGRWKEFCDVRLKEIITQYGLCYSFNFNLNDIISLQKRKEGNDTLQDNFVILEGTTGRGLTTADCSSSTSPLQTPNYELGLNMDMRKFPYQFSLQNRFKNPFESIDGFHLIFHHPEELPTKNSIRHYTVSNQSLIFWILPQLTITDESLMDETPAERNCYSRHEKQLKFFKFYNKVNCEQECLANQTMAKCGCVQFFMMRNFINQIKI